tara:strand:- start:16351 stop:17103 length:753 start_codon:yes stop_codon:yes gene_type:complete
MSSLCARNHVTEMDVLMVETPKATESYVPVPYSDVIDLVKVSAEKHLSNYVVEEKEYGLARDGQQLFGVYHMARKEEENLIAKEVEMDALRISIGFRGSHDKSLALGVICGASVFVCDNLMFHTSGYQAIRRHTKNVATDFDYLVWQALAKADMQFGKHNEARLALKEVEVSTEAGYEMLGRMFGHKLLTPVQMSGAVADWREPEHEVFDTRNAWSLYNAMTLGLKKGSPSLVINRYTKAHDWAMEEFLS